MKHFRKIIRNQNTYDTISLAFEEWQKKHYTDNIVVAFFFQKYDWESEWEFTTCYITTPPNFHFRFDTKGNPEKRCDIIGTFEWDFNEGQTDCYVVDFVELQDLADYYSNHFHKEFTNQLLNKLIKEEKGL